MPTNVQAHFDDFAIHQDSDCREEDDEECWASKNSNESKNSNASDEPRSACASDGVSDLSFVCYNGSYSRSDGNTPRRGKEKDWDVRDFLGDCADAEKDIGKDGYSRNSPSNQEGQTTQRQGWKVSWQPGVVGNVSVPPDQDFAVGARYMASNSTPSFRLSRGASNKEDRTTTRRAPQFGRDKYRDRTERPTLTPLPPLPSLYPSTETGQNPQTGVSIPGSTSPTSETTGCGIVQEELPESDTRLSDLEDILVEEPIDRTHRPTEKPLFEKDTPIYGSNPNTQLLGESSNQVRILGLNHLEDPFVSTFQPLDVRDTSSGDIHSGPAPSSLESGEQAD